MCQYTSLSCTTTKQRHDELGAFDRNRVASIQRSCTEVSLNEVFQYPLCAFPPYRTHLKKTFSQPSKITGANLAWFDAGIIQSFCRSLRPYKLKLSVLQHISFLSCQRNLCRLLSESNKHSCSSQTGWWVAMLRRYRHFIDASMHLWNATSNLGRLFPVSLEWLNFTISCIH